MNRYVKVKGHDNWFLNLTKDSLVPENLQEDFQEKLLRKLVFGVHQERNGLGWKDKVVLAATNELDYVELVNTYGSILVRPIGSFMLERGSEIIGETFCNHFPTDDVTDHILICENDESCESPWRDYLMKRFPDQRITTINFFDLRTDEEISKYFRNAKCITFSTTFSDFGWFEKLTKNNWARPVIGFCHDKSKWVEAKKINPFVEIVDSIK